MEVPPTLNLPQDRLAFFGQPVGATAYKSSLLRWLDYLKMPWKNGLGTTQQICIEPPVADFRKDTFTWRLSSALIQQSCAFSIMPGYSKTIILLPSSFPDTPVPAATHGSSVKNVAELKEHHGHQLKLRHQDQVTHHVVKPLTPYKYDSELETSCEVHRPCRDLTLILNRDRVDAEISIEIIDQSQDYNKLLLATWTLVFCVEGRIKLSIEGGGPGEMLGQGETLVLERGASCSPKYLHVRIAGDGEESSETRTEATFVLFSIDEAKCRRPSQEQLNLKLQPQPSEQVQGFPLMNGPEPRSRLTSSNLLQRQGTAGSVLVYDDQPVWLLPQDIATKMNLTASNVSGLGPFSTLGSPPIVQFSASQIYEPPEWVVNQVFESDMAPAIDMDELNLDEFPVGKISTAWIRMMKQGLSDWIRIPVTVARGNARTSQHGQDQNGADGKKPNELVVGITAALHGNEINGVSCIHRLIGELDVSKLNGTVVGVPCLNIPGYLNFRREFSDGKDLNRLFPGDQNGTASQIYAYQIMHKIVCHFSFLIDLHTASFGRVNSYYVRADMNDRMTSDLARLQQPQIILHNSGQDGTLRSAASQKGIKSITVEIGNPQQFQNQFIMWSFQGLLNILCHLKMYALAPDDAPLANPDSNSLRDGRMGATGLKSKRGSVLAPYDSNADLLLDKQPFPPVICSKGFWTYTKTGGVLEVYPAVNSYVQKGMLVARIKNIFGNVVDEYVAPCDGMVIGRSSNPVAMAGDRIIHFGVPHRKGETLPAVAKENY